MKSNKVQSKQSQGTRRPTARQLAIAQAELDRASAALGLLSAATPNERSTQASVFQPGGAVHRSPMLPTPVVPSTVQHNTFNNQPVQPSVTSNSVNPTPSSHMPVLAPQFNIDDSSDEGGVITPNIFVQPTFEQLTAPQWSSEQPSTQPQFTRLSTVFNADSDTSFSRPSDSATASATNASRDPPLESLDPASAAALRQRIQREIQVLSAVKQRSVSQQPISSSSEHTHTHSRRFQPSEANTIPAGDHLLSSSVAPSRSMFVAGQQHSMETPAANVFQTTAQAQKSPVMAADTADLSQSVDTGPTASYGSVYSPYFPEDTYEHSNSPADLYPAVASVGQTAAPVHIPSQSRLLGQPSSSAALLDAGRRTLNFDPDPSTAQHQTDELRHTSTSRSAEATAFSRRSTSPTVTQLFETVQKFQDTLAAFCAPMASLQKQVESMSNTIASLQAAQSSQFSLAEAVAIVQALQQEQTLAQEEAKEERERHLSRRFVSYMSPSSAKPLPSALGVESTTSSSRPVKGPAADRASVGTMSCVSATVGSTRPQLYSVTGHSPSVSAEQSVVDLLAPSPCNSEAASEAASETSDVVYLGSAMAPPSATPATKPVIFSCDPSDPSYYLSSLPDPEDLKSLAAAYNVTRVCMRRWLDVLQPTLWEHLYCTTNYMTLEITSARAKVLSEMIQRAKNGTAWPPPPLAYWQDRALRHYTEIFASEEFGGGWGVKWMRKWPKKRVYMELLYEGFVFHGTQADLGARAQLSVGVTDTIFIDATDRRGYTSYFNSAVETNSTSRRRANVHITDNSGVGKMRIQPASQDVDFYGVPIQPGYLDGPPTVGTELLIDSDAEFSLWTRRQTEALNLLVELEHLDPGTTDHLPKVGPRYRRFTSFRRLSTMVHQLANHSLCHQVSWTFDELYPVFGDPEEGDTVLHGEVEDLHLILNVQCDNTPAVLATHSLWFNSERKQQYATPCWQLLLLSLPQFTAYFTLQFARQSGHSRYDREQWHQMLQDLAPLRRKSPYLDNADIDRLTRYPNFSQSPHRSRSDRFPSRVRWSMRRLPLPDPLAHPEYYGGWTCINPLHANRFDSWHFDPSAVTSRPASPHVSHASSSHGSRSVSRQQRAATAAALQRETGLASDLGLLPRHPSINEAKPASSGSRASPQRRASSEPSDPSDSSDSSYKPPPSRSSSPRTRKHKSRSRPISPPVPSPPPPPDSSSWRAPAGITLPSTFPTARMTAPAPPRAPPTPATSAPSTSDVYTFADIQPEADLAWNMTTHDERVDMTGIRPLYPQHKSIMNSIKREKHDAFKPDVTSVSKFFYPHSTTDRPFGKDIMTQILREAETKHVPHGVLVNTFRSPLIYTVETFANLDAHIQGELDRCRDAGEPTPLAFTAVDYTNYEKSTVVLIALLKYLCHRFRFVEQADQIQARMDLVSLETPNFSGMRLTFDRLLTLHNRLGDKKHQVDFRAAVYNSIRRAPAGNPKLTSTRNPTEMVDTFHRHVMNKISALQIDQPGVEPDRVKVIDAVVTLLTDDFHEMHGSSSAARALKVSEVVVNSGNDHNDDSTFSFSTDAELLQEAMHQLRLGNGNALKTLAYKVEAQSDHCFGCGGKGHMRDACPYLLKLPTTGNYVVNTDKIFKLNPDIRAQVISDMMSKGKVVSLPPSVREDILHKMQFGVSNRRRNNNDRPPPAPNTSAPSAALNVKAVCVVTPSASFVSMPSVNVPKPSPDTTDSPTVPYSPTVSELPSPRVSELPSPRVVELPSPSVPPAVSNCSPTDAAIRMSGLLVNEPLSWSSSGDIETSKALSATLPKHESNRCLTYYQIQVRPIYSDDIDLKDKISAVQSDAQLCSHPLTTTTGFSDSGAATNLCSIKWARDNGFFSEDAGEKIIKAYKGPSDRGEVQRVTFLVVIKGVFADTGLQGQIKLHTSALVVDMDTPLIFGSDFLDRHSVASHTESRLAAFKTENDRRLNVSWLPWTEAASFDLHQSCAEVDSLPVDNFDTSMCPELVTAMSDSSAPAITDAAIEKLNNAEALHLVATRPNQFMSYVKRASLLNRLVCCGLAFLARLYRLNSLSTYIATLENASYLPAASNTTSLLHMMLQPIDYTHLATAACNDIHLSHALCLSAIDRLLLQQQLRATVPVPSVNTTVSSQSSQLLPPILPSQPTLPPYLRVFAADFLSVPQPTVAQPPIDCIDVERHRSLLRAAARAQFKVPVITAVSTQLGELSSVCADPVSVKPTDTSAIYDSYFQLINAITDIAADPPEDVAEHQEFLECMYSECTTLSPELRPPLFPEQFWVLVADSQKPLIKQRWSRFSDKRLRDCMSLAMSQIRVCDSTPARLAQKTFFQAQVFANLDRFFHPDPDEIPNIPNVEMKIELKDPNCREVHLPVRRMQPLEKASQDARCNAMLRQGLLEPSTSAWNNPVHMVPQKEKIKAFQLKYGSNATTAMLDPANEEEVTALYRMTGDYRLLNLLTYLERFPLPRIMDLIDACTERSNRYSSGDLASAFFLIKLSESCRHLTAFSTTSAHLQYRVMPQGVKSAANVWARTIQSIFSDLLKKYKLMVYQDDVINRAKGFREHYLTQQATYDRLSTHLIVFKPSKTFLNFDTQKILGHVMSEEGRSVDPGLTRTIRDIAPPRNLHDIQSLIGLARVATEYVPELADILIPIQALCKKGIDVKAHWNAECDEALAYLKHALTESRVLMIPDINKSFRVVVDACRVGRGLGAVLQQSDPRDEHLPDSDPVKRWRPVAYWSRTLSSAERSFSATELEATALHDCILHWYCFLYGTATEFTVLVDHYALVYLITKMGKSVQSHQRLTRLCLDLQGYTFRVVHRNGKDHLDADAVSRLLHHDEIAYVHTEASLREDSGPLTARDIADLQTKYKTDADFLIETIRRRQVERKAQQSTAIEAFQPSLQSSLVSLDSTHKPNCVSDCSTCASLPVKPKPLIVCPVILNIPYQLCLECQPTIHSKFCRPCAKGFYPGIPTLSNVSLLRAATAHRFPPVLTVRQLDRLITDSSLGHFRNPQYLQRFYSLLRQLHAQLSTNRVDCIPQVRSYSLQQILQHSIAAGIRLTSIDRRAYECELSYRREETPRTTPSKSTKPQRHRLVRLLRTVIHRLSGLQYSSHKAYRALCNSLPDIVPSSILSNSITIAPVIVPNAAAAHPAPPAPLPQVVRPEPAHDTRRARERREEHAAMEQELLDNRLEQYVYLHGQIYQDPQSEQLYEIIDTTITKHQAQRGGAVVKTIAWPISHDDDDAQVNRDEQQDEDNWQTLDLKVAQKLVDDFTLVMDPSDGTPYPVSDADWLLHQQQDEWCNNLLQQLNADNCFDLHPHGLRDDHHYDHIYRPVLDDGSLGPLIRASTSNHRVANGNVEMIEHEVLRQIVVPSHMQRRVLHQHHAALGHPGGARMHRTTRLRYWWKSIVADCIAHAQECRHCELRKADNHRAKVPVQEFPVPPYPHHTISIDLTGPFNDSHGYRYILVYKCALTKWVEVRPIKDKTSQSVVEALLDIFMRHGNPQRMLSDNGREFKNVKMKAVCAALGVLKIHITPINPRANGLAENFMRTLKDMLAQHVNARQSNWSEHLAAVAHVYNTTVNVATGYTPFYLNHGRQCATPDTVVLSANVTKNLDVHVQGLTETLALAWRTIGGSTWRSKTEKYNARPSQPLEFTHYKVDQLVFIKRIPRRIYKDILDEEKYHISAKLQARYAGPYRIVAKISDVLYEARIHGKVKRVHAVNLKPAMVDLHVAHEPVDAAEAAAELEEAQAQELLLNLVIQSPTEFQIDNLPTPAQVVIKPARARPPRVKKVRLPKPVPFPRRLVVTQPTIATQSPTLDDTQPLLPSLVSAALDNAVTDTTSSSSSSHAVIPIRISCSSISSLKCAVCSMRNEYYGFNV